MVVNNSYVHGETDEFRFVEILRYLSRLDGVDCADGNKQDIKDLAEQEGRILHSALEDCLVSLRISRPDSGWFHPHPQDRAQQLTDKFRLNPGLIWGQS